MKTYTSEEIDDLILSTKKAKLDCQKDNYGQWVFYSNVYEWLDGTFHDEPDPAVIDVDTGYGVFNALEVKLID